MEMCQSNGTCGGGTNSSITTECGNNRFCDGAGNCGCRTASSWNLLRDKNPGLNGNTNSPWQLSGSSYAGNQDVDGCSGSGSILLNGSLGSTFGQCVDVPNGARDYYFGFQVKGMGSGTIVCYVNFLPSGSPCDIDAAETSSLTVAHQYSTENWQQASTSGTSDSNTTHVYFYCVAVGSPGGHYDQFYLSNSPPGSPAF
jgi:hypothetical protein